MKKGRVDLPSSIEAKAAYRIGRQPRPSRALRRETGKTPAMVVSPVPPVHPPNAGILRPGPRTAPRSLTGSGKVVIINRNEIIWAEPEDA